MRHIAALFCALVLAACGTAPVARNQSPTPTANPAQAPVTEAQKAAIESALQFLTTAAASDFHKNVRSKSVSFREVRLGHVMTSEGAEQYILCGEFLAAQPGDKGEWLPFATIKTSGYEQWNGAEAETFCRRTSLIWDKQDDLSSLLQSRFDALH